MYRNENILAIIPARGGSKGIKLKNIRKINGIPLIGYVGSIIKNTKIFDNAVVSTDSEKVAKVAKKYGLEVPFYRPKIISGDYVSDFDVLDHALKKSESIYNKRFNIIVMLQPTSPLRKPIHIKKAVDKLIDRKFDSVWTISKSDTKNHPYKQLKLNEDEISLYDRKGLKIIARQQLQDLYYRNGVAYVFTRDCLIKYKTIMPKNIGALLIKDKMVSIDTEWDLKLVKYIMSYSKL